jgi:protein-disulfide isomerase
VNEYPGKVRVVLKHLLIHPQQVAVAHVVACAAAKQGKFKEFYTAFWKNAFEPYQKERDARALGEENVLKIATEVGLDIERVHAEVPSCQKTIDTDEAELQKFRVNGTPTFFINGEHVGGGASKPALKKIIDQKLAIAEQSGVPAAEYYEKEIRAKGEKLVKRREAKRPGSEAKRPR